MDWNKYLEKFQQVFESHQIKVDNEFSPCLEGEKFYYRLFEDKIQIAVKETFDRWANSVDYVVWRLPKKEKQWVNLFVGLEGIHQNLVKNKSFNNGFGKGEDVSFLLRN